MMEDWTDIIGEELENIEEPLPADDWSVLQQKYAAAQKRKKAAAFAWAGGITSVAAAVAFVLLLVRPDSTVVENDLVAETLPPIEDVVPVDSSLVESAIDTVLYVTTPVQKKVSIPVDVVKKTADDASQEFVEIAAINRSSMPVSLNVYGAAWADPQDTIFLKPKNGLWKVEESRENYYGQEILPVRYSVIRADFNNGERVIYFDHASDLPYNPCADGAKEIWD